jgi:hypothetical protein
MAKSKLIMRFSIGTEDGLRAGIWRVWTVHKKSDIYIAVRTIAGLYKVSLHETGQCNASMTSQAVLADPSLLQKQGGNRHLDRWQRPPPMKDLLSIPLRLRFPASELRPGVDHLPNDKAINWLPTPPEGHALDVLCIFTGSEFSGTRPWKGDETSLLASRRLPNGETFWLISHLYKTEYHLVAFLDSLKPKNLPINSRLLIGETGPANIRIITDASSHPFHSAP